MHHTGFHTGHKQVENRDESSSQDRDAFEEAELLRLQARRVLRFKRIADTTAHLVKRN